MEINIIILSREENRRHFDFFKLNNGNIGRINDLIREFGKDINSYLTS
jgi:hypothetical protein